MHLVGEEDEEQVFSVSTFMKCRTCQKNMSNAEGALFEPVSRLVEHSGLCDDLYNVYPAEGAGNTENDIASVSHHERTRTMN